MQRALQVVFVCIAIASFVTAAQARSFVVDNDQVNLPDHILNTFIQLFDRYSVSFWLMVHQLG
jgi:hypothetical protein